MRKAALFFTFSLLLTLGAYAQVVKVSSYGFEDPSNAILQAMHSDNDTLLIEDMGTPWELKPLRFYQVKNKTILFEKGAEVRAKPGAFPKTTDALFKFIDCENIALIGTGNTLAMNKPEYTNGEWRHVIRLRGCKNVTIQNLTLRDSGGDGITIGRSNTKMYSENITITNIKSLNNRRQGISIVSAKNVRVSHSVFANTEGTLPGAGVDIEPDIAQEMISEVVFENCTFKNNYHAGIKVALGKLTSSSTPVDLKFIDCVLSNNFSPENPKPPAEIFLRSNKLDPVKGHVLFENLLVKESRWGLLYAQKNAAGFKVDFVNCTAQNICKNEPRSAIYLEVPHYRENADVGGYFFKNLFLDYEVNAPIITVRGSRRGTLQNLRDINGSITVPETTAADFEYINYNKNRNIKVDLKVVKIESN